MKLSDLLNKDDKAYLEVCKKVLGPSYRQIYDDALNAAGEAGRSVGAMQKINVARRAFNLVFLGALKENGVTNWRKFEEEQEAQREAARSSYIPPPVDDGRSASGTKPTGRYKGPRIVDMR